MGTTGNLPSDEASQTLERAHVHVRHKKQNAVKTYKLTENQIKAIAALWDASDPFAQDTESEFADTEERLALIAARDMMGEAFPVEHPVYGNADYYDALKAIQSLNLERDGTANTRRKD